MGIDVFVFDFLLDWKGCDLGDTLCLGRQGFHVSQDAAPWQRAAQILTQRAPGVDPEDLVQADGYSETFLRFLGAQTVKSMDFSPFEGAELVHDLNKPIKLELIDRFDFIFDGGTLEHVYNIPMAIANIRELHI